MDRAFCGVTHQTVGPNCRLGADTLKKSPLCGPSRWIAA